MSFEMAPRKPVDYGPTSTVPDWVLWHNGPARRNRLARLNEQRAFGVFFYVPAEPEGAVIAFPERPNFHGAAGGDHAHPKRSHATAWPSVLHRVGPFRRASKDLSTNYPVIPRGRVIYSIADDQYRILLSPAIPASAYQLILEEFGLPDMGVEFDLTDVHYLMTAQDLEIWETLVLTHRLYGEPPQEAE